MQENSKPPSRPQPRTLRLPAGTAAPRGVVQRVAPPEFWIIWADGRRGPRFRHPSKAAAMAEAERLASLDPGRRMDVYGCAPAGRVIR